MKFILPSPLSLLIAEYIRRFFLLPRTFIQGPAEGPPFLKKLIYCYVCPIGWVIRGIATVVLSPRHTPRIRWDRKLGGEPQIQDIFQKDSRFVLFAKWAWLSAFIRSGVTPFFVAHHPYSDFHSTVLNSANWHVAGGGEVCVHSS